MIQMLKATAVGTLNTINPCLEALTVNVVMCTDYMLLYSFDLSLDFLAQYIIANCGQGFSV